MYIAACHLCCVTQSCHKGMVRDECFLSPCHRTSVTAELNLELTPRSWPQGVGALNQPRPRLHGGLGLGDFGSVPCRVGDGLPCCYRERIHSRAHVNEAFELRSAKPARPDLAAQVA